jgi:hypothetical protein
LEGEDDMISYYAAFWINGERITDYEEFYAAFEADIWRLLAHQAEQYACASIPEFMAGWTLEEMRHTLAFYAMEVCLRIRFEDIYANATSVFTFAGP